MFDQNKTLLTACLWMACCVAGREAAAHPGSINMFVDGSDQLYILDTFAPGQFVRFGDIEVSSATPGFGVNFPANGVTPGTSFDLEIVQDLFYWDGGGLGSTDVAIEFDAPPWDNEGNANNSPVSAYSISQSSGRQTGMHWGNYSGNNFWESHSTYFMDSLEAPHGIYGIVMRMQADLHVDTEPMLIPFIYDPTSLDDPDGQWSVAEEAAAIDLLRLATVAHERADLNIDGHVDTGDIDALAAEAAAGTNSPAFDLTGDGLVDQNDIEEWLVRAGTAKNYNSQPFLIGDANLDGQVDGQDFIAWNANKFTATTGWSAGDFNGDGLVDGQDFVAWNANKFMSADTHPTPVPELVNLPFIALLALVCLAKLRR
ncbi:MAG: hypothetical protein AAGF97_02405 [Planctomycetota bacterium]